MLPGAADEVRATLAAGGCPLPLITSCEQAYRAASRQVSCLPGAAAVIALTRSSSQAWRRQLHASCQLGLRLPAAGASAPASPALALRKLGLLQAGFDGPFLIEIAMLRLLVTIYQASQPASRQPARQPGGACPVRGCVWSLLRWLAP